jgi:hypothetical protein
VQGSGITVRDRRPGLLGLNIYEAAACSDAMGHHCTMLQLAIRSVHPNEVENLRRWFTQLQTERRDEVVATLIDETVTQETAVLIPNDGNPILVYAMEVEDPIQSKASANSGKHPIDAQHRAVMQAAISGSPEHETILDVSP